MPGISKVNEIVATDTTNENCHQNTISNQPLGVNSNADETSTDNSTNSENLYQPAGPREITQNDHLNRKLLQSLLNHIKEGEQSGINLPPALAVLQETENGDEAHATNNEDWE